MSALLLPTLSQRTAATRQEAQHEPASADRATWTPVSEGFWAASDERGFVGTIELFEERFVAVDAEGIEIGRYDTLPDAKNAVMDPDTRAHRRRVVRQEVEHRLAVAAAVVGGVSCIVSALLIVFGFGLFP